MQRVSCDGMCVVCTLECVECMSARHVNYTNNRAPHHVYITTTNITTTNTTTHTTTNTTTHASLTTTKARALAISLHRVVVPEPPCSQQTVDVTAPYTSLPVKPEPLRHAQSEHLLIVTTVHHRTLQCEHSAHTVVVVVVVLLLLFCCCCCGCYMCRGQKGETHP